MINTASIVLDLNVKNEYIFGQTFERSKMMISLVPLPCIFHRAI